MRTQAVSYRITLVHGTFARDAAWTKDSSRLVRALQASLDGPVEIERCTWTGGISAGARAAAAEQLADQLRTQATNFPHERRFVVAHSHGGNIALYALRNATIAAGVAGLACLASPFLVARRRDLGAKGVTNIIMAAGVALVLAHQLLIKPILPPLLGEYGAVAIGFKALLVIGVALLIALVWRRWDAWVERLLYSLRLAVLPAQKLLLLRPTGDEASAFLLCLQFLSMLGVRLFNSLQRLHARLEQCFSAWSRLKLPLVGVLAAGVAVICGATLRWPVAGLAVSPAAQLVGVLAVALFIVMPTLLLLGQAKAAAICFRFAATLTVLPVALILALCMLLIDWRVAVANLLIDVTVEPAPLGAWTLHQFVPREADAQGGGAPGLAHSAIYDDERAIGVLVEWIKALGPCQNAPQPRAAEEASWPT